MISWIVWLVLVAELIFWNTHWYRCCLAIVNNLRRHVSLFALIKKMYNFSCNFSSLNIKINNSTLSLPWLWKVYKAYNMPFFILSSYLSSWLWKAYNPVISLPSIWNANNPEISPPWVWKVNNPIFLLPWIWKAYNPTNSPLISNWIIIDNGVKFTRWYRW